MVENYCKEVGLFRDPNNDIKFSQELHLNLSDVLPCISGPKRPEDKILLSDVKKVISTEISKISKNKDSKKTVLKDGSIVIAAITSCTNTSNPSVIIGAGLLAKNAIDKGLNKKTWVKTSLAPGSKVVENYLRKADLLKYFNELGFNIIGYGCTTCIGNSGPIDEKYVKEINDNDIVASSVLSGNRNFEGRIHPEVKMNFLMSPMLVIAYSLIGNINFDITRESLGKDKNNNDVFLSDIWPSSDDINSVIQKNIDSNMFVNSYKDLFEGDDNWKNISTSQSEFFNWEDSSTYIQPSPFFTTQNDSENKLEEITDAYPLLVLGDSVTTDHISPAGSFKESTPAGTYLVDQGTSVLDFNSYGSRRGNFKIMQRGTFANIRIANKLVPDKTGGYTKHIPTNKTVSVYEASELYKNEDRELIVIAGKNYGCGSSRDWAAKGTKLLGVKAVIAESFERIHRSNLVGMGVLPLEFIKGENYESLGIDNNSHSQLLL